MTEQSREEFEKWLKSELPTTWRLAYSDIEDIEDELVDAAKASILEMRLAWKASRAAIVVHILPATFESFGNSVDWMRGFSAGSEFKESVIMDAIKSEGLTIK